MSQVDIKIVFNKVFTVIRKKDIYLLLLFIYLFIMCYFVIVFHFKQSLPIPANKININAFPMSINICISSFKWIDN